MIKNRSCISCAAWNVFPINSLLTVLYVEGGLFSISLPKMKIIAWFSTLTYSNAKVL